MLNFTRKKQVENDGKLNFIPKLGKSDLFKYMSQSEAYKIIDYLFFFKEQANFIC